MLDRRAGWEPTGEGPRGKATGGPRGTCGWDGCDKGTAAGPRGSVDGGAREGARVHAKMCAKRYAKRCAKMCAQVWATYCFWLYRGVCVVGVEWWGTHYLALPFGRHFGRHFGSLVRSIRDWVANLLAIYHYF